MESNMKKCPFCNNVLDEKSILYKGYYVCSSCNSVVNESQNADIIRRYSNYIRILDFKHANSLRHEMLDDIILDINELQLFTFYSAILDLFLSSDPNKIIKFLNDSTATDTGVVIEVLNFLSSLVNHIEKLGGYILKYVNMQEKYLTNLNNRELDRSIIEVKKHYFKSILNKSSFVQESYRQKKMSLNEIIELVNTKDPANIAALYSIFNDVADEDYSPEEINNYLLTCDYSLELYYEKNKRKITGNYREYNKKANSLRKKLHLKKIERYKWQKRVKKNAWNVFSYFFIIFTIVVLYGIYNILS